MQQLKALISTKAMNELESASEISQGESFIKNFYFIGTHNLQGVFPIVIGFVNLGHTPFIIQHGSVV